VKFVNRCSSPAQCCVTAWIPSAEPVSSSEVVVKLLDFRNKTTFSTLFLKNKTSSRSVAMIMIRENIKKNLNVRPSGRILLESDLTMMNAIERKGMTRMTQGIRDDAKSTDDRGMPMFFECEILTFLAS
jgi:hypothetical protein